MPGRKLTDVDPKTAGPQYDCTVATVMNDGTATATQTALPKCAPEDATAANAPCWHLVTDPVSCPNSEHIVLEIEGQASLPAEAHVVAKCAVDPAS